ncbi:unnamed protein product [Amoebophrya sp. A120]|nr:unnamed protein product [Amoebophrya sp. A120]|eukprot:GSA120T00007851001.1
MTGGAPGAAVSSSSAAPLRPAEESGIQQLTSSTGAGGGAPSATQDGGGTSNPIGRASGRFSYASIANARSKDLQSVDAAELDASAASNRNKRRLERVSDPELNRTLDKIMVDCSGLGFDSFSSSKRAKVADEQGGVRAVAPQRLQQQDLSLLSLSGANSSLLNSSAAVGAAAIGNNTSASSSGLLLPGASEQIGGSSASSSFHKYNPPLRRNTPPRQGPPARHGLYANAQSSGYGPPIGAKARAGTPRSATGDMTLVGLGSVAKAGRPPSPRLGQQPASANNPEQQGKRVGGWTAKLAASTAITAETKELEEERNKLNLEIQELSERRKKAEKTVQELQREEAELTIKEEEAVMQRDEFIERLKSARETWQAKIQAKKKQKDEMERKVEISRKELRYATERFDTLQRTKQLELEEIAKHNNRKKCIEEEFKLRHKEEMAKLKEIESWKARIEEAQLYKQKIQQKRSLLVLKTKERFNEYIEVKGNIRVFVRIRPMTPAEESNKEKAAQMKIDERSGNMELESASFLNVSGCEKQTNKWTFHYDRVFNTDASQKIVFEEISQLVKSALDGYKVAIFAYGQTGSGKTYTMEGPPQQAITEKNFERNAGMIPRAVKHVFQHMRNTSGWQFECSISFMEIYNENIRDLLNKGKDVSVIMAPDHESTTNASTFKVEREEDVRDALQRAHSLRSYASTAINDRSSRSHTVFQLNLHGKGPRNTTLKGLLSLVDLAGSERVEKSKATGDRMKEAQHINKSLSALAGVITALSDNKSSHIPYRDSKLTQMLKDSLGGDSKTLMFANISPLDKYLSESINSLRFAAQVNSVHHSQSTAKRGTPAGSKTGAAAGSGGTAGAAASSSSGATGGAAGPNK